MHLSSTPRRARVATMLAFATNGALPATLLARYAEVKDTLDLGAGLFGIVVVAFTLGATCALHLPGVLLRRFGSRLTATLGTVWIAAALLLAAIGVTSGSAWLFATGLLLAGLGDAVVDVAQNAQGLRVQQVLGRSLLSSMHAGWSVGAAAGGALGTAAAAAGVPLALHLAVWGGICAVTMALAAGAFLPDAPRAGEQGTTGGSPGARGFLLLAPFALVAVAGISVEDVGNNWSAVLLASERDVPVAAAGIGLTVLLGAQFLGRLVGDRFIDRVGARIALGISLSAVAAGLLLAAWAPWASLSVVGLALAGLGCAITVPVAFASADALPGLRVHAGVTWIGWAMRATALGLSPAIGGLTALSSLPLAISAVAMLALIALLMQLRRPVR